MRILLNSEIQQVNGSSLKSNVSEIFMLTGFFGALFGTIGGIIGAALYCNSSNQIITAPIAISAGIGGVGALGVVAGATLYLSGAIERPNV